MSQQTQVATVIPYYDRWLRRFPDWASLAVATEQEVLGLWQGLGYYSRARNLHRAAQAVAALPGGKLPRALDQIRALPGVGRYTAGAVAAFAFNAPAALVDANVARVLARVFGIRLPVDAPAGLEEVWRRAESLQAPKSGRAFNGGLMELGALLCTPRAPRCPKCPVRDFCAAAGSGDPESLPVKKPRRRTVALSEPCLLVTAGGKVLLEHQTGPRWRGLWKLPAAAPLPEAPPLLVLDYPFTHHRVTLSVYAGKSPGVLPPAWQWHPLALLAEVPLAAAHRRALARLLPS